MSTIFGLLSRFKYAVILVAVGMLMWTVTWRWSHTFTPAWAWIAGAVVVAAIVILVYEVMRRRHERKMAAGLESGISSAEGDKIDLKGEIKALRDNWSSSVDKLQTAQGGSGRTALYRLPWFMIIGEPASGKSTLLRKSGLDFPIGDAAVRGMHGTRNCDWWFANEAVFLDTAGRYIIETQEQEWIAFLSLLAKYRKKKPISGVLVAVAANSLLTKSHDELLQDGKRIRNRIDELIDVLGVNFPVYVLVTKVDLVSGFVEFFNPIDPHFRDQMLGWTLPIDANARFDGETFERKFGEVSEQVYRMRPWLESRVGPRDLAKAFLFPEEFSYLGDPLRNVLEVVFKPNVYQETPVCRGVYFSSGTQVGSPLARALEDMAKDLHIPADFGFGTGMKEDKEIRTYFIKDLVSSQIMSDRDLTWRTGRAEVRAKKRRTGWGMVGVGLSAILGLVAASSFFTNRSRLSDFEGHLPKSGKPLEVAMGTLASKNEAKPAGFADFGLNYSDEVIPTIDDSFRKVVAKGLVTPPLADFKQTFEAGIAERDGTPDLGAFLGSFSHYLYLKDGVEGRLPETMDAAAEEPHLEVLMGSLRSRGLAGEAGSPELRKALFRFGTEGGLGAMPEYDREQLKNRMKEVEDLFAARLDQWLSRVETFVAERKDASGMLRRDYEDAIRGLKEACSRAQVRPHPSLDGLRALASEIQAKASGLGERTAGQTPITAIAPSEADLVATLRMVKERAPAGSNLPPRAEALLAPFEKKEISGVADPRQKALLALVAEVGKVMEPGPEDGTYPARPTKDDLARRRREIDEEVAALAGSVWSRIEDSVKTLETGDLWETVKEGDVEKKVRKPGWYDTIPLLAQARRADQRKERYLGEGLSGWFADGKWRMGRPTDSDSDIFSVRQFTDVMLPLLREQVAFFEVADENRLVATDIALRAQAEVHKAVKKWTEDADAHWSRQFQTALPTPAQTLPQVRAQLDEMKGVRPSLLMTTCRNVQTAIGGVNRISEDPRGDPVLANSEEARAALWNRWAVCFQLDDLTVYTIYRALGEMSDFSEALGLVVSPLGTDAEQARKLVAAALKGGASFLAQASAVPERLLTGAAEGTPRAEFAIRLQAIVKAAWGGLVEKAAEDVNDRWSNVRVQLTSATTPAAFQMAFGPSGPFGSFRKDYLEPFFDGPDLLPRREIFGSRLELTPGLRQSVKQVAAIAGGLSDPGGSNRSDRVILDLQLGGTAANGLVVEYQPKTGQTVASNRFINGPRVTFEFEWSPLTSQEFRFTVYFPSGEPKIHRWSGPWAVAEAFRAARREGERFIWPRTPGSWKNDAGEVYEVALVMLPGTSRSPTEDNTSSAGGNPMQMLLDGLPAKAVMVEGK